MKHTIPALLSGLLVAGLLAPEIALAATVDSIAAMTPRLNQWVPIDVVHNPPLDGSAHDIVYPSPTDRSSPAEIEADDALGFTWIWGLVNGKLSVVTDISFPPADNAWDCSHSSISYGLWLKGRIRGELYHVGSGQFFGTWTGSNCILDTDSQIIPLPQGSTISEWGSPTESIPVQYLLGVKKWAHNDPGLGHTGRRCQEGDNCYFGGRIRMVAWCDHLSIGPIFNGIHGMRQCYSGRPFP